MFMIPFRRSVGPCLLTLLIVVFTIYDGPDQAWSAAAESQPYGFVEDNGDANDGDLNERRARSQRVFDGLDVESSLGHRSRDWVLVSDTFANLNRALCLSIRSTRAPPLLHWKSKSPLSPPNAITSFALPPSFKTSDGVTASELLIDTAPPSLRRTARVLANNARRGQQMELGTFKGTTVRRASPVAICPRRRSRHMIRDIELSDLPATFRRHRGPRKDAVRADHDNSYRT